MTHIIGHRGARNELTENTVESFVHAQINGCLAFELDVRLSSDHQLMVFHDALLYRMTGVTGLLSSFSASQLARIPIVDHVRGSSYAIPTLEQVVDAVPKTIDWQFEVKSCSRFKLKVLALALVHFIHSKNISGRVTVTSSNPWFLETIKACDASLRTGLVADSSITNPVEAAKMLECELLAVNDRCCDQILVDDAKANELEVSVWTVNKLERMRVLKGFGVDSIITDIPSLAIESLQ